MGHFRTVINLTYVLITVVITAWIALVAYDYYMTPLESRFFHDLHGDFKPSGALGHGLGIIGSLLMIIGVGSYMMRKRLKMLRRIGLLKYWLEFHIFMCTLGPILVLFHTAFKFGGLVAISFWSMVAVFLSGILGRYIYLQIPHTIEGRMMSRTDIQNLLKESEQTLQHLITDEELRKSITAELQALSFPNQDTQDDVKPVKLGTVASHLKDAGVPAENRSEIVAILKRNLAFGRRIKRLEMMQNLFRYWHVAHLPFALLMLIIMIIHIIVALLFGYTWIF
ncbi:MAG: hypothetical protein KJ578_05460 [Bacteroidetes bacterium]|nr:hypothetical protein [Bacteroidota bacterium]MBU1578907.1 hypothetical protein [Bacteroidota bacterium]MBU2466843.1 hypothetical protein [Bacteroidota bacterium]MBU2557212.1 hypothetical protein [Bacteroidota bacterium]